jgi:hypothetical protein
MTWDLMIIILIISILLATLWISRGLYNLAEVCRDAALVTGALEREISELRDDIARLRNKTASAKS